MTAATEIDRYESLLDICAGRRSVREFLAAPVSPELIEKILTVARTSPYASNKKNWDVVVVDRREVIESIADAVRQKSEMLKEHVRDDLREGFERYAEHFTVFRKAPLLLVPVFRVGKAFSYMVDVEAFSLSHFERDNYIKSISCVAMLILLAVESLGLGACLMTGPLVAETEINHLLNIKKGRTIGTIIPIGHKPTPEGF